MQSGHRVSASSINIINGTLECGRGQPTPLALDNIQLCQNYAGKLGVAPLAVSP